MQFFRRIGLMAELAIQATVWKVAGPAWILLVGFGTYPFFSAHRVGYGVLAMLALICMFFGIHMLFYWRVAEVSGNRWYISPSRDSLMPTLLLCTVLAVLCGMWGGATFGGHL